MLLVSTDFHRNMMHLLVADVVLDNTKGTNAVAANFSTKFPTIPRKLVNATRSCL